MYSVRCNHALSEVHACFQCTAGLPFLPKSNKGLRDKIIFCNSLNITPLIVASRSTLVAIRTTFFNFPNLCISHAHYICRFRKALATNSDYFPIQQKPAGLYNEQHSDGYQEAGKRFFYNERFSLLISRSSSVTNTPTILYGHLYHTTDLNGRTSGRRQPSNKALLFHISGNI